MASSLSPSLNGVQKHRKRVILGCGIVALSLMSVLASSTPPESAGHESVETAGFLLIVACILGRTWCALYIGGKKKQELVTCGPYSLVRNPLYLFTLIGAAGVGLTTGSVMIGAVVAAIVFVIFNSVIRLEEEFLAGVFGAPYRDYLDRVPRWTPRLSGWRDQAETVVIPRLVLFTFRDACIFLIAVPLFEQIDRLQTSGILPVLLRLP